MCRLHGAASNGCVASAPLGSFHLSVQAPGNAEPRSIQQINLIRPGDRFVYRPVRFPEDLKEKARVSLVLAPAGGSGEIKVFDPVPAAEAAEWVSPFRAGVACIVLGPQGLDRKKVSALVRKDHELITQLADYAEQTAQMENLIEALAAAEAAPSSTRNLDAALSGFAAQSGAPVPKLDRTQPTNQQALVLMRALNPALASYDPLAPTAATRMQQSAGLAASVAALFFGSNVGLAAGGTAMALNLRTLLFPDTEFRSALAQRSGTYGLTLCGKNQPVRARTRLAYLWARRIPNAGPPSVSLDGAVHLPLGVKSTVPVETADWKLLERAADWRLVGADGRVFRLTVKAQPRALELDLTAFEMPPGVYKLQATWDWDTIQATGELRLHRLADFKGAALTAESQDRLIEGAGPVKVTLAGADFQFVEKVKLGKDELEFTLPAGRRAGPQETMKVILDTGRLKAGRYVLAIAQSDGVAHEAGVRVLPPPPAIAGLPARANLGEGRQRISLRGSGLDRIEHIEIAGASVELGPPGAAARDLFVRLGEAARRGDSLDLALRVEGMHSPVRVPGAIVVAGPRPRITGMERSLPEDLGVELSAGELPSGSFVSFSLRAENIEGRPAVRLGCGEGEGRLTVQAGEKRAEAKLDSAGPGMLFLSLDPGAVGPPGCTLVGILEAAQGRSDDYELGRVIRLPRIESFTLTDEKMADSVYAGIIIGQDLELIERVGWNATTGLSVEGLPRPVAGGGQRQMLKIPLPWPSPAPHAPVYIWLRGESEGRATKARS
jgi:hypothetical protein